MRLIGTRKKDKIKGHFIHDATRGFWGDKDEGREVLAAMGLPPDELPFSMAFYLKHHKVQWQDADGNTAFLSFCVTEQRIEFYASYLGKRKTSTLFREWETYEDKGDVFHLESEAIGNMSMLCLYNRMVDERLIVK